MDIAQKCYLIALVRMAKFLLKTSKFMLEVFDGCFGKEFNKRIIDNRLVNVEHYVREVGEFDLKEELDIVTIVLN